MLNSERLSRPVSADAGAMIAKRQAAATFVSRNELFAGLAMVGFANGISERASNAVADTGIAAALVSTFEISAIVWVAWVLSLVFLLRMNRASGHKTAAELAENRSVEARVGQFHPQQRHRCSNLKTA
jgi:hypothetical protein